MNEIATAVEPRPGEKRPAPLTEEDPLVPSSRSLPTKRKFNKLDSASQSLLTEIFALQDTLSENEIEALARKVNSTRTQVLNFFHSWKSSVIVLVDKSKNKSQGFHTKIAQPSPPPPPQAAQEQPAPLPAPEYRQGGFAADTQHIEEPATEAAVAATTEPAQQEQQQQPAAVPSTVDAPTVDLPVVAPVKHEYTPLNRIDSERLALQLVSAATTARHNTAAALAPYLDAQGGIRDIQAAVSVCTFAQATVALSERKPTFTAQLQLCDALIATIPDTPAYTFLSTNVNLSSALQTMITRCVKGKQITLVVRALHAMIHFGGFRREFIGVKTMQMLKIIVSGEIPPHGHFAGTGASHPAVKEAATKLLALYPVEEDDVEADVVIQGVEDNNKGSIEGAEQQQGEQQQQKQQQQVEAPVEKTPAVAVNLEPSTTLEVPGKEKEIASEVVPKAPEAVVVGQVVAENEKLPTSNAQLAAAPAAAAEDAALAATEPSSPNAAVEEEEEDKAQEEEAEEQVEEAVINTATAAAAVGVDDDVFFDCKRSDDDDAGLVPAIKSRNNPDDQLDNGSMQVDDEEVNDEEERKGVEEEEEGVPEVAPTDADDDDAEINEREDSPEPEPEVIKRTTDEAGPSHQEKQSKPKKIRPPPFKLPIIQDATRSSIIRKVCKQPLIDFKKVYETGYEGEPGIFIDWVRDYSNRPGTLTAMLGLYRTAFNSGIGNAPLRYYNNLHACSRSLYLHIVNNVAPAGASVKLSLDFAAPKGSPDYLKALMPILTGPGGRVYPNLIDISSFYNLEEAEIKQQRFEFLTLVCHSDGELPETAQAGATFKPIMWFDGKRKYKMVEIPPYTPKPLPEEVEEALESEKEDSPEPELTERTTKSGRTSVPNYAVLQPRRLVNTQEEEASPSSSSPPPPIFDTTGLPLIEDETCRQAVQRICEQQLIDFGELEEPDGLEGEPGVFIKWERVNRLPPSTFYAMLGLAASTTRKGIGDAPTEYFGNLYRCAGHLHKHILKNVAPAGAGVKLSLDFAAPKGSPDYLKALMPVVTGGKIVPKFADISAFYTLDDEMKRQRRFEFLTLVCYAEGELSECAQEGAITNITMWIDGVKTTQLIKIPDYVFREKEESPAPEPRTTKSGKAVPNYKSLFKTGGA